MESYHKEDIFTVVAFILIVLFIYWFFKLLNWLYLLG